MDTISVSTVRSGISLPVHTVSQKMQGDTPQQLVFFLCLHIMVPIHMILLPPPMFALSESLVLKMEKKVKQYNLSGTLHHLSLFKALEWGKKAGIEFV